MSSIESVVELIELIRNHPDACNWTGGLSSADLALAEEQLGTQFPPSYRYFLTELGSCEAGSEEFLGIYRTPAMADRLLGTVDATLDARSDPHFPGNLLVIQYDGMGGLISRRSATRTVRCPLSCGIRAPLTEGVRRSWRMTSEPTLFASACVPWGEPGGLDYVHTWGA